MSHFDARIRLPGQTRLPVSVVIDISDQRIRFLKDDKPLGDWALDEVEVDVRADAIYLTVNEEVIALSVTDTAGFANALRTRPAPGAKPDTSVVAMPVTEGNDLASRMRRIDPETQFEEVKRRIDDLAEDLDKDSVTPQDVFGRWLRLLKEINLSHGQGAMPTPLFYRLNSQLLDLIPAPRRDPSPALDSVNPPATALQSKPMR